MEQGDGTVHEQRGLPGRADGGQQRQPLRPEGPAKAAGPGGIRAGAAAPGQPQQCPGQAAALGGARAGFAACETQL